MAVGPFRRVCPIHFHIVHLICCSKGVSWAGLQSYSFDIVFGQKILKFFWDIYLWRAVNLLKSFLWISKFRMRKGEQI
jgi:hypothetical protein